MVKLFLTLLTPVFLLSCSVVNKEKPLQYNGCGIKGEARKGNFFQKYNCFFWVDFIF
jgi:hypothetical protein